MALIDSVSGLLETRYNDQKFDGISAFYQCAIYKKDACSPANILKAESGPYTQSLSNIVEFKTDKAGLSENELNVSAFPNPFSENLTVELLLDKKSDVYIEVLNSTGQKTTEFIYKNMSAENQHIIMDAKTMRIDKGICFLKIIVSDKVSIIKCLHIIN